MVKPSLGERRAAASVPARCRGARSRVDGRRGRLRRANGRVPDPGECGRPCRTSATMKPSGRFHRPDPVADSRQRTRDGNVDFPGSWEVPSGMGRRDYPDFEKIPGWGVDRGDFPGTIALASRTKPMAETTAGVSCSKAPCTGRQRRVIVSGARFRVPGSNPAERPHVEPGSESIL